MSLCIDINEFFVRHIGPEETLGYNLSWAVYSSSFKIYRVPSYMRKTSYIVLCSTEYVADPIQLASTYILCSRLFSLTPLAAIAYKVWLKDAY